MDIWTNLELIDLQLDKSVKITEKEKEEKQIEDILNYLDDERVEYEIA